jgi:hypothetical protein
LRFSRPNIDLVEYGGCKIKENGDYQHPTDCTRFITCSNGLAADMACADCNDPDSPQCAGQSHLRFDDDVKRCEWPLHTPCHPKPEPEPEHDDESFMCNGTEVVVGQACDKNDCDRCGFCIDTRNFFLRY